MSTRPHLSLEPLEPRRLLSAEGLQDGVNHDAELYGAAPGREPIYPPLAPAVWMEDAYGSFELPEEITVAHFPADQPADSLEEPPDAVAIDGPGEQERPLTLPGPDRPQVDALRGSTTGSIAKDVLAAIDPSEDAWLE